MEAPNTVITPAHLVFEEIKRKDNLVYDGEFYITALGSLITWKGKEPFLVFPSTTRYRRIYS